MDQRAQQSQQMIDNIARALVLPNRLPYDLLRREIICQHGYDTFRNLQARAFKQLFKR